MKRIAHIAALQLYRLLPGSIQRLANRTLTTTYGLAAKVLVTAPGGKVLVVNQTYRDGWDLPGGFVDKLETPEQAALRELREETGLKNVTLTQKSVVIEPEFRMVQILFTGEVGRALPLNPDGVEISEIRWAHAGEVNLTPAASEAITVLNKLQMPYHVSSCEYYQ